MSIEFGRISQGELTEEGWRIALANDEAEARMINELLDRCWREGLPCRVVMNPYRPGRLTLEGIPYVAKVKVTFTL